MKYLIKYRRYALWLGLIAALVLIQIHAVKNRAGCSTCAPVNTQSTNIAKGQQEKMSTAVSVMTTDFNEKVLQNNKIVLVDFWAPWCGPCKMMGPVIDELAKDYTGKADVVKINVDENPELAARYRVSSIPTLMIFKQGEVVDRIVGLTPKAGLADKINKQISSNK